MGAKIRVREPVPKWLGVWVSGSLGLCLGVGALQGSVYTLWGALCWGVEGLGAWPGDSGA